MCPILEKENILFIILPLLGIWMSATDLYEIKKRLTHKTEPNNNKDMWLFNNGEWWHPSDVRHRTGLMIHKEKLE